MRALCVFHTRYRGTPPDVTLAFGLNVLAPAEEPRVRVATALYAEHSLTCAEIWQTLGISRATFYRYVTLGRQEGSDTV